MEITIKNANSENIEIAFALLKRAAAWLESKNIDYWQNWKNPPSAHKKWIEDGFSKGEFFFIYNCENTIIGMYRLQFDDEMFWGKQDDKAGYIHSFTIDRKFKGRGVGYLILKGIERELAEKGFEYLRLDCSPDIKGLCDYYESYGFQSRETVLVHGEKLRLYEKRIR